MVSPLHRGPVIEHQQYAGHRFDQEQKGGDSAHAPRVAESQGVLGDGRRVQVQQEVGRHDGDPSAAVQRRRVADDAFPQLRLVGRLR